MIARRNPNTYRKWKARCLSSPSLFISFSLVGLALILSVLVSRSVSDPLNKIKEAMKAVGTGDMNARAEILSNDVGDEIKAVFWAPVVF
jgi:nitrogen fixation/metabolism regulation signal transduction histidine kinase